MKKITLRPYQDETIKAVQAKFREGFKRVLIVLFMGLGKSVIACKIIQLTVQNKKRVLFIAHRTFLITQIRDKLLNFGITCGVIKAGFKEDRTQLVQVASIQTLNNRGLPIADVVFIDEAHLIHNKQYMGILQKYIDSGAFIVGLSATPFLLEKKKGLNILFETFVNTITVQEGIDQGYIIPSKVYQAKHFVDTSHMKKSKGDFDEKELMKAFDEENVAINLVEKYHTYIGNKKTMIFCVNKEHCRKTTDILIREGYRGNYIVADTPEKERDESLQKLLKGDYDFLANVGVYVAGFDMPELGAIVLNYATASKAKYFQSTGRGGRPLPEDIGKPDHLKKKPYFIVLDMADNTNLHGWVELPFEISLEPQANKKKAGVAPIKTCGSCGFMMKAQLRQCPECGAEQEIKKSKAEIQEMEFVELDKKKAEVQKYLDYGKDKWHLIPSDMLVEYAKAKGYRSPRGWANYLLLERGEGIKKVVIRNYTEPDYFKQCAILRKGYFQKTYPIDAEVWQFIEETNKEVIFEYKLAEKETII